VDFDLPTLAKPIAVFGALFLLLGAERLWPASRWGAGSWRHDLRNLSLGALNGLIGVALAAWVLPTSHGAESEVLAVLGTGSLAWWLVGLLLLDLWTFAWHWLHHALPLLWRVHRVHHTDTAMDASTALRFHPIETTVAALARLPLAWALGLSVEHVLLFEVILLPSILFHHSNLRVSPGLDRRLRLLVVTPALHRTHHSPVRENCDSNFGSVLSVWDRLFRTLRGTPQLGPQGFGVPGLEGPRWQSWRGLLALPFVGPTTHAASDPAPRVPAPQ